jgi:hypothetical protein
MSKPSGNRLLEALKTLLVAVLRLLALLFGFTLKAVGFILTKLSELTFKLAEK